MQVFIYKKIPKKNLFGNLYMANIVYKKWFLFQDEIKKNCY